VPPRRMKLELLGASRRKPERAGSGRADRFESARATTPRTAGKGGNLPGEGGGPRRRPGPARSANIGDFVARRQPGQGRSGGLQSVGHRQIRAAARGAFGPTDVLVIGVTIPPFASHL
jgi:hypothetical protein